MKLTHNPFEKHPITILMIDDDAVFGKTLKNTIKEEKDFNLFYFEDPIEALEKAKDIKPTVFLVDLHMPVMDGLAVVKSIRKDPDTCQIPIVMLSSDSNPETKSKLFKFGANGYIEKNSAKIEILAQLRYHSEAYIHLLERDEAYQALLKSQKRLKDDIKEAEYYIRSLLPKALDTTEVKADWEFLTSHSLGGDSLGYHWIDLDHFAMYLIDVSGHGVGSALLSVSVLSTLRSQTLSGVDFTDPSQVLKKLNETFRIDQHNDLYFTIWYGVYSKTESNLVYSSGGHPPAILIREEDQQNTATLLSTSNAIIGVIEEMDFTSETVPIKPNDKLYIFSDGAYEIDHADGSGMIQPEDFYEVLKQPLPPNTSKLKTTLEWCQKTQGKMSFDDDFSLIEILFH